MNVFICQTLRGIGGGLSSSVKKRIQTANLRLCSTQWAACASIPPEVASKGLCWEAMQKHPLPRLSCFTQGCLVAYFLSLEGCVASAKTLCQMCLEKLSKQGKDNTNMGVGCCFVVCVSQRPCSQRKKISF